MEGAAGPPQRAFDDPRTGKTEDVDKKYYETPEYSRWRKGPESFGPLGRSLLTLLLFGGLMVGYWLTQAVVTSIGDILPTSVPRVGYAVVAVLVAAWGLSKIWKRSRFK